MKILGIFFSLPFMISKIFLHVLLCTVSVSLQEEHRARDLFYALWIPDLFMERVRGDGSWSLFCPNEAPGLADCWGEEFEKLYTSYEAEVGKIAFLLLVVMIVSSSTDIKVLVCARVTSRWCILWV